MHIHGAALGLVAGLSLGVPAVAQVDRYTGAYMLPGCRYVLHMADPSYPPEAALGGMCLGVVLTLSTVIDVMPPKFRFCLPRDVTMSQQIQVIVDWLESHPDQEAQPFILVANYALRLAWPCPGA
jgi:hypothetical protein